MAATKTIKIKPEVLKSLRYYARQRMPMVLEHFQKKSKLKFGVDEKFLKEIEASEHELSLELIKELATLYKFPLAGFLLPKPLKDDLVPPDYRKIPNSERGIISPKAALALRSARRAQYVISTLEGELSSTLPRVKLEDDPEQVGSEIRKLLSGVFRAQEKIRNPYKFFSELRDGLEELGIVVLKMSFPLEDARAFSLTDQKPYTIVINNKDGTEYGYSPKIFSLLHEFSHVLLRDGGLCNDFSSENELRQEVSCNAFAAAALLPAAELKKILEDKNFDLVSRSRQIEIIDEVHNIFLTSGEVVIRRLYSLTLIDWDEKDVLISEWNEFAKRYRKKAFIPRLSPAQKCVGQNGKYYTNAVFDAVSNGSLTPENVVSYLGIKLKHFHELRKVVSRL